VLVRTACQDRDLGRLGRVLNKSTADQRAPSSNFAGIKHCGRQQHSVRLADREIKYPDFTACKEGGANLRDVCAKHAVLSEADGEF
jgi:uncharacterized protein YjbI with pentapeptide repeats